MPKQLSDAEWQAFIATRERVRPLCNGIVQDGSPDPRWETRMLKRIEEIAEHEITGYFGGPDAFRTAEDWARDYLSATPGLGTLERVHALRQSDRKLSLTVAAFLVERLEAQDSQ